VPAIVIADPKGAVGKGTLAAGLAGRAASSCRATSVSAMLSGRSRLSFNHLEQ